MNIILITFVYILLIFSAFVFERKLSPNQFLKLTLFYLLIFVSFKIQSIYIPIGILIGFIVLLKVKKDRQIVMFALTYSLLTYTVVNYLTPQVPLKYISETIKVYDYISDYNEIEYVKTFTPSEHIQVDIKKFLDKETDLSYFTLVSYILLDNGIQINSTEDLLSAPHEEDITGQRIKKDNKEDVIYLNYNGQDYLGVFEISKTNFNLKMVIKGKIQK